MGEVFPDDIVPILVHALAHLIEHGPYTEVAHAGCAEIDRGVCCAEVEVLILAAEIAFAAGEVDDVVLVDDLHLFII